MKTAFRALAAVGAALAASPAHAGDLNGSLGITFAHTPFNGNNYVGLGGKAMVGYAADWGGTLDAGYLGTGQMRDDVGENLFDWSEDAQDAPDPDAAVRVGVATLGYAYRPAREFTAALRSGYYEGRSWIWSDEIGDRRRYAHGVVAGLSAEYRPSPRVGVRWSLDVLFNVPDYSDVTKLKGNGRGDFFLFTVGVVVGTGHGGEREPSAAAQVAAETPPVADRYQQAAAAAARQRDQALAARQAETPPVAPVPAATEPPVLAAGQPARLKPGAAVRTRATPEGDVLPAIAPGDRVTLKVSVRNATGAWWYLEAPAASGWARDSDLEAVAP